MAGAGPAPPPPPPPGPGIVLARECQERKGKQGKQQGEQRDGVDEPRTSIIRDNRGRPCRPPGGAGGTFCGAATGSSSLSAVHRCCVLDRALL